MGVVEIKKILVILGPTASGKTDLALTLAKKFNGELISCDSRQVYARLDIGTGKLPSGRWKMADGRWKKGQSFWWIDGVKVWMYDVVDLRKQYSVADYVKDTKRVIKKIKAGKLPIVVGGTGLYLKSLLEGLPNLAIPVDLKLRKQLNRLNLDQLQTKLRVISLSRWKRMNNSDRQNPRRLIRSIELSKMYPLAKRAKLKVNNYNILKIGLNSPRPVLYEKINSRAADWIDEGMIDEVCNLLKNRVSKKRFKSLGLGYAEIIDYLDKKISDEQLIDKMQTKTRQYAKRQLIWFKKEKGVLWFDITNKRFPANVENMIARWYHLP